MADNINVKNLDNNELEQVSGGTARGRRATTTKRCKYCHANTPQRYKGRGFGFDSEGIQHECNLWECIVCNNTNYWTCHERDIERLL